MQSLFFELIRAAIGTQTGLSRIPTESEWEQLYQMAVKQSLVGVCFAGLQHLGADSEGGFEQIGMSAAQYLNWMAMAAQIQERNEVLNRQCIELQARLAEAGMRSSILKGQGMAALYGELQLFRQSGDIDVYVDCGRDKAISYARRLQGTVEWDYKHLHLKAFHDTDVEMHYVPEVFFNLPKNRRLQRWFLQLDVQNAAFQAVDGLICPGAEFNLFYILLHIYRHFLSEGVGMRQLLDYSYVLQHSTQVQRQQALQVVKSFGMLRFVKGVMWIMHDVFCMSDDMLLCSPDVAEGRYILDQVMAGGNFGRHDKRLAGVKTRGKIGSVARSLRHTLHLLAHYPAEALWTPIWIVWHFLWKRTRR